MDVHTRRECFAFLAWVRPEVTTVYENPRQTGSSGLVIAASVALAVSNRFLLELSEITGLIQTAETASS